MIPHALV